MDISHPLTKPVSQSWQLAFDVWEKHLQVKGIAERTLETRVRHLRQFARECGKDDVDQVTVDDVITWAASKRWMMETRHAYYTSMRSFWRFYSSYAGVDNLADVLPTVRRYVPPPRPTPKDVVAEAYREANERGKLILALAACGGLRAKEIAVVHLDHVSLEGCYAMLQVNGKGGKFRHVPIPEWLGKALLQEGMRNGGYVFPGYTHGHLAPCTVSQIARLYLPGKWTLHTLRHRYATNVYQKERDLISLKEFLGHSSVATTQRYAQPPESTIIASIEAADLRNY